MSNFNIINDLAEAVKQTGKPTTSAYDTPATVTRIEGDTAWVHIPGGVDETPIKKTINAKSGDTVQVRVGGGSAWLVGNQTAPPTDDTKAIEAKEKAEKAGKTATDFVADMNNGIFVHPKDNDSDGVQIRDTVEIIRDKKSVAEFGETARVGANDGGHIVINSKNLYIYRDGSIQSARIGAQNNGAVIAVFGEGNTLSNILVRAHIFGNNNKITNNGTAIGKNNQIVGNGTAIGSYLHYDFDTAGYSPSISPPADGVSLVIGCYNKKTVDEGDYAFIIGNGSGENYRSDCFKIDWKGGLYTGQSKTFVVDSKNDTITVGHGSTAQKSISVSKSGYTPWALRGFNSSSASCNLYKCYLSGNDIVVRLYNPGSSDIDVTITVYVAYIATSAL